MPGSSRLRALIRQRAGSTVADPRTGQPDDGEPTLPELGPPERRVLPTGDGAPARVPAHAEPERPVRGEGRGLSVGTHGSVPDAAGVGRGALAGAGELGAKRGAGARPVPVPKRQRGDGPSVVRTSARDGGDAERRAADTSPPSDGVRNGCGARGESGDGGSRGEHAPRPVLGERRGGEGRGEEEACNDPGAVRTKLFSQALLQELNSHLVFVPAVLESNGRGGSEQEAAYLERVRKSQAWLQETVERAITRDGDRTTLTSTGELLCRACTNADTQASRYVPLSFPVQVENDDDDAQEIPPRWARELQPDRMCDVHLPWDELAAPGESEVEIWVADTLYGVLATVHGYRHMGVLDVREMRAHSVCVSMSAAGEEANSNRLAFTWRLPSAHLDRILTATLSSAEKRFVPTADHASALVREAREMMTFTAHELAKSSVLMARAECCVRGMARVFLWPHLLYRNGSQSFVQNEQDRRRLHKLTARAMQRMRWMYTREAGAARNDVRARRAWYALQRVDVALQLGRSAFAGNVRRTGIMLIVAFVDYCFGTDPDPDMLFAPPQAPGMRPNPASGMPNTAELLFDCINWWALTRHGLEEHVYPQSKKVINPPRDKATPILVSRYTAFNHLAKKRKRADQGGGARGEQEKEEEERRLQAAEHFLAHTGRDGVRAALERNSPPP